MDWAAASTIISALIAAIVSGIAYQLRRSDDRTKILNSSLFTLLEVWHLLKMMTIIDPKTLATSYVSALRRRFPTLQISPEVDNGMLAAAMTMLMRQLVAASESQGQPIRAAFQTSVHQLAGVDPLLAFRLSGNENLKSTIDVVATEVDKLFRAEVANVPNGIQGEQALTVLVGRTKDFLYQDAVHDLERSLRSIALRIGPVMYVRMAVRLFRAKPSRMRFERTMDRLLDELLVPAWTEISQVAVTPSQSRPDPPTPERA
jgi:hypothetical protein